MFFDGFALAHLDVGEVTLRVRHGGRGTPVLLLHGHPRTHATWHRVAPALARWHHVVCPDLRGYGRSSKPPATMDHPQRIAPLAVLDAVPIADALARCTERFARLW